MTASRTARLRLNDITFSYRSGRTIFENWNQEFEAGQITALTGASGRGKSTLLYIAGLLMSPRSGEVILDGASCSLSSDSSRSRIRAHSYGFVFQDASLDSTRTVLDNITEPEVYRGGKSARSFAKALELMDLLGIDVDPRRRPGQISGGQAQRIALCRALLGAPGVVIADEPTGNLDVSSASAVVDALKLAAEQGATVIVATHDQSVTSRSDVVTEL